MVVVEPMEQSPLPYHPSNPVTTTNTINVYLGPGSNYATLNTANGEGTILEPLNELGGVFAKGTYWWKVGFDSGEGWVPESEIMPLLKFKRSNDFKAR